MRRVPYPPHISLLFLVLVTGCAANVQKVARECGPSYTVMGKTYQTLKKIEPGFTQQGVASWYGPGFHGKKTASGETYDMHEYTAAHNVLPLHTLVKVTNMDNGKEVLVRINDRGPFVNDRVIDLSLSAARGLGMEKPGTAPVRLTVVDSAKTVMVASCGKQQAPAGNPCTAPNPFYNDKMRNLFALRR
jgi:rare lipoprotein A